MVRTRSKEVSTVKTLVFYHYQKPIIDSSSLMASRGNRKRKRGSVEERIDLIHVTLRVANIGNRTAYMRDLKEYLEAMDDLQTLLDSGKS